MCESKRSYNQTCSDLSWIMSLWCVQDKCNLRDRIDSIGSLFRGNERVMQRKRDDVENLNWQYVRWWDVLRKSTSFCSEHHWRRLLNRYPDVKLHLTGTVRTRYKTSRNSASNNYTGQRVKLEDNVMTHHKLIIETVHCVTEFWFLNRCI